MAKQKINVQGLSITIEEIKDSDYISLTDIAKQSTDEPRFIIQNWLKNSNTITYLWEWELLHNPNLNRVQLHTVLETTASNRFVMSPKKWIELTGAVGMVSQAGRSGGTLAHKDIALNFCYWLSPKFQIYLIKEFQRLKEDEADRLGLSWNLRRELSKANYHIHTDAVRTNLVPMLDWNTKREGIHFASEADLLNMAVFGMTAKQWKAINTNAKGNIRDGASETELQVLANMESANALLIEHGFNQGERLAILSKRAARELEILESTNTAAKIKKLK